MANQNEAQINANRELVAISVELDLLRARMVALGQGSGLRGASQSALWDAHDRLLDARTNIELAVAFNR